MVVVFPEGLFKGVSFCHSMQFTANVLNVNTQIKQMMPSVWILIGIAVGALVGWSKISNIRNSYGTWQIIILWVKSSFKVHEGIYSTNCYSCFSQEASSDNEYLVIGDLKIHVHNFCFHLALCRHLDNNSDRTLRLELSSSYRMWNFSAIHYLQSFEPGL